MNDATEVAIVGAGPAGAAAAIALADRGRRVTLVDAAPARRGWRVGETLAGYALPAMEALGVAPWLEESGQLASTAIGSAWGSGEVVVTHAITNPHGGGWHLDRAAFDAMLVDRAEGAGAVVWRKTRATKLRRERDGFVLEGERGKARRRTRAQFVIDATGPSRWATRRLAGGVASEAPHRQIAVAAELEVTADAEPWPPALLLEACDEGWWYSVPVPGNRAVAVFVTDADLRPRGRKPEVVWREALAASEHTLQRLVGCRARSFGVHPCGTSRLLSSGGPGWTAVGDAAMVFDPMSSQGIAKALVSGLDVARALAERTIAPDLVLSEIFQATDGQFAAYQRTLDGFYARETRWPGSAFWRRRHERRDAVASPPVPQTSPEVQHGVER